ncbi:hypothetical protein D3C85_856700 [compost metagenome]
MRGLQVDELHGGHAPGVLVVDEPGHLRVKTDLEIALLLQQRIQQHCRAGLCIGLADETLAMAAVLARRETCTIGVGVGARRVGGGQRKRFVAKALRGRLEDAARLENFERGLREVAFSGGLEGVAAFDQLPADIAGLPRDAEELLEQVVVRLHLRIADAPVLHRHLARDRRLAVARFEPGAQGRVVLGPAPGLSVPVIGRAAHAFAGKEGFHAAYRQRTLAD